MNYSILIKHDGQTFNPLVVSRVQVRGARRYGRHPLWYKVAPWWKKILFGDVIFDCWQPATVSVRGSDGEEIGYWEVKSNQAAKNLAEELRQRIDEKLEKFAISPQSGE